LDHEAFHDAVERESVVEALVWELNEISDGDGSDRFVEREGDDAVIFNGDLNEVELVIFDVETDACVEFFTVGFFSAAAGAEASEAKKRNKGNSQDLFHSW
jgi:F420-0:gamma-glutamyl ligase